MPPMEWIWLGAVVVFAVAEAATAALVSLWFIGGSLAGLIAALCGAPLWLQFALFVAVSAILLAALRPLARSRFNRGITPTNAERCVGQIALVTEAIDNVRAHGAVRLSGVEWSARSADGSEIPLDTPVRVLRVDSAKLIVERAQEKEEF